MITIKDVASAAGVSVVTVSRVINNPEMVSEERRVRVEGAIRKLNYSPNDLARSLVRKNTRIIGVLLPDIANVFTPHVISSISDTLEEHGYHVFLCITNGDPQKEANFLRLMLEKRVEGLMLLGPRKIELGDNEMLGKISQSVPIIVLDYTADCNMYCVRSDEAEGVYRAVEYLVELGHRKIGFINGVGGFATYFYKQAGFEKALAELKIFQPDNYCVRVAPYYEGGIEGMRMLLGLPVAPTAVLTAGDQIALGAYYEVQARGMRIPDDISIVGFSGSTHSKFIYPRLTTVDQRAPEMGSKAADMMLRILNGEKITDRNIIMQPEITKRDSCRRAE